MEKKLSDVTSGYIKWLLSRIEKTEKEIEDATEFNLKISKGAKITAYKESLKYIIEHR